MILGVHMCYDLIQMLDVEGRHQCTRKEYATEKIPEKYFLLCEQEHSCLSSRNGNYFPI